MPSNSGSQGLTYWYLNPLTLTLASKQKVKTMTDKALEKFLMLLFGMGGITILILAWVQPMPVSQRILATFLGSIGLFFGGGNPVTIVKVQS